MPPGLGDGLDDLPSELVGELLELAHVEALHVAGELDGVEDRFGWGAGVGRSRGGLAVDRFVEARRGAAIAIGRPALGDRCGAREGECRSLRDGRRCRQDRCGYELHLLNVYCFCSCSVLYMRCVHNN